MEPKKNIYSNYVTGTDVDENQHRINTQIDDAKKRLELLGKEKEEIMNQVSRLEANRMAIDLCLQAEHAKLDVLTGGQAIPDPRR